jgi:hypothetical protein
VPSGAPTKGPITASPSWQPPGQPHTVALPHYIVKFVWNPYLNLTMTWSKSDHVSNLIGFSMESLRLDITW